MKQNVRPEVRLAYDQIWLDNWFFEFMDDASVHTSVGDDLSLNFNNSENYSQIHLDIWKKPDIFKS